MDHEIRLAESVILLSREAHDFTQEFKHAMARLGSLCELATKRDLREMESRIMASIDQVLQDVTDESSVIDSIAVLISGLQQQLNDALSGTTLPTEVQAKVDAVFAQAEKNKEKLAAALVTNTPAA